MTLSDSRLGAYSPLEVLLRERPRGTLIADGMEVPVTELHRAARVIAARLKDDGIERGDFVFLSMLNSAEWLAAALGVMFAGAVLVPVNTRFTVSEISDLMEVAPPRAWIADKDLASTLLGAEQARTVDRRYEFDCDPSRPLAELREWGAAPPEGPVVPINGDESAAVFFTAGTTGRPKGAVTSHAALAAFADVAATATSMTSADNVILPMPMFYTGGIKASLANLLAGARVIVFRQWKPPDLVAAMDEYGGTFLWGVTSVWALMLKAQNFSEERVASLRAVWRTGSFTPRALLDDMLRVWPDRPHFHSYGLTECNVASMEQDAVHYPDSCGFPTLGVSIDIEGRSEADHVGEIRVRGDQQFSRYLNDPEATAGTLERGWVRTGDQGWIGADGRLHVLGRGSDIIIRGGENISAAEIERVILNLHGVEEAAVVGVPDDVFGHELRAVVVPTRESDIDPDSVREQCRSLLAEFKVPKFIEFRDVPLPKNPSGKIAKAAL